MDQVSWSIVLANLVAALLPLASSGSTAQARSEVIAAFRSDLDTFKADLRRLSFDDFQHLLPDSRETPTHFKWHLFASEDESYKVWLHEYKNSAVRLGGYAQTVHNHRYAMTSLLLSGGYRHSKFVVDDVTSSAIDLQLIATSELSAGASYSLEADEFHSVTEIVDGTVSLVIQWSSCDIHSTSVDLLTRKVVQHFPIESRFDILRSVFD